MSGDNIPKNADITPRNLSAVRNAQHQSPVKKVSEQKINYGDEIPMSVYNRQHNHVDSQSYPKNIINGSLNDDKLKKYSSFYGDILESVYSDEIIDPLSNSSRISEININNKQLGVFKMNGEIDTSAVIDSIEKRLNPNNTLDPLKYNSNTLKESNKNKNNDVFNVNNNSNHNNTHEQASSFASNPAKDVRINDRNVDGVNYENLKNFENNNNSVIDNGKIVRTQFLNMYSNPANRRQSPVGEIYENNENLDKIIQNNISVPKRGNRINILTQMRKQNQLALRHAESSPSFCSKLKINVEEGGKSIIPFDDVISSGVYDLVTLKNTELNANIKQLEIQADDNYKLISNAGSENERQRVGFSQDVLYYSFPVPTSATSDEKGNEAISPQKIQKLVIPLAKGEAGSNVNRPFTSSLPTRQFTPTRKRGSSLSYKIKKVSPSISTKLQDNKFFPFQQNLYAPKNTNSDSDLPNYNKFSAQHGTYCILSPGKLSMVKTQRNNRTNMESLTQDDFGITNMNGYTNALVNDGNLVNDENNPTNNDHALDFVNDINPKSPSSTSYDNQDILNSVINSKLPKSEVISSRSSLIRRSTSLSPKKSNSKSRDITHVKDRNTDTLFNTLQNNEPGNDVYQDLLQKYLKSSNNGVENTLESSNKVEIEKHSDVPHETNSKESKIKLNNINVPDVVPINPPSIPDQSSYTATSKKTTSNDNPAPNNNNDVINFLEHEIKTKDTLPESNSDVKNIKTTDPNEKTRSDRVDQKTKIPAHKQSFRVDQENIDALDFLSNELSIKKSSVCDADRAPADKTLAEKTPADRISADRSRADRSPADRTSTEKITTERILSDRSPADRTPTDRTPAERARADRKPADKTSTGKVTADITPAEKIPAEKTNADRTTANRTLAYETPSEVIHPIHRHAKKLSQDVNRLHEFKTQRMSFIPTFDKNVQTLNPLLVDVAAQKDLNIIEQATQTTDIPYFSTSRAISNIGINTIKLQIDEKKRISTKIQTKRSCLNEFHDKDSARMRLQDEFNAELERNISLYEEHIAFLEHRISEIDSEFAERSKQRLNNNLNSQKSYTDFDIGSIKILKPSPVIHQTASPNVSLVQNYYAIENLFTTRINMSHNIFSKIEYSFLQNSIDSKVMLEEEEAWRKYEMPKLSDEDVRVINANISLRIKTKIWEINEILTRKQIESIREYSLNFVQDRDK